MPCGRSTRFRPALRGLEGVWVVAQFLEKFRKRLGIGEVARGVLPYFTQRRNVAGQHRAPAQRGFQGREAAKRFEFERAAKIRDTIKGLRTKEFLSA